MQPSRNFDDLKFSSIHRRILLWGSGGPFLDGYVLVMIGVALEQLTPALKLDADWIGLLGAGTLAGLFVGTSLFGYISDKVGRRKMFLSDIIAIGVISVATMFVSSPVELLVMRVLIGIVIGADYPIATSMITEFSSTRQRAFSISFIAAMWYVGATCADLVGYWLYDVEGGWRWMLGSAAIPCLLILIGRFELPESPRWLLRKGRVKECEEMMIKLFGEPVAFEEEQPRWMCCTRVWDWYWVITPIRRIPELMQLDSAKSIMRNLPPKCTAGFARLLVKSFRRVPRPPASIRATDFNGSWRANIK